MKPLINLKALLAVLLIFIVPAAFLVAYFRNYTTEATGHEHGEKGKDAAAMGKDGEMAGMKHGGDKTAGDMAGMKPGGDKSAGGKPGGDMAGMKHGDMPMPQGGPTQQTPAASQPAAQLQKDGDHAAMGHGNKTQVPAASQPQPEEAMQPAGATAGQSPIAHGAMGAQNPSGAKAASAMQTRPEPMQDGIKAMGTVNATIASQSGQAAVRLFHAGATDFFLVHAQYMALNADQTKKLNQIKEQALLDKASVNRKIQEAEQQLWKLTAADQPDAAQIETKVRETERLRSDQRLAFIRAVDKAAKVLSKEQTQVLIGTAMPATPAAKPAHEHKP